MLRSGGAAAGVHRTPVSEATDPETLALQEQNGFADAVITGDDIILSGVVTELQRGDAGLEAAYARTLDTIRQTLERAGASWDDVIEIDTFHTDLLAQMAAYVAAKRRVVRVPHRAWTAIRTTGLALPGGVPETRVRAKRATTSA